MRGKENAGCNTYAQNKLLLIIRLEIVGLNDKASVGLHPPTIALRALHLGLLHPFRLRLCMRTAQLGISQ